LVPVAKPRLVCGKDKRRDITVAGDLFEFSHGVFSLLTVSGGGPDPCDAG
jgi:hypothetical protein